MRTRFLALYTVLTPFVTLTAVAQGYPDQQFIMRIDSLVQNIESSDGIMQSPDGTCITLRDDRTQGFAIFRPQTSTQPYNQGLPSWNGTAPDANSSFLVQMRFPYGGGWSPWLTVGFWKRYWWSSYGVTSYGGGYVDIDYVKLSSYVSSWQFKVTLMRSGLEVSSPTVHKISFFVSDSRTTASADISQIVSDAPDEIFVPTEFIYQYAVDPDIGGSICSPTSVAMILRSYNTSVDPLGFALDTRDPYYSIFGVWPRVVQNASEYGLDGAVTRYRSWSQAREVLAGGGRISMSVGPPLYAGHLMMLAGFSSGGDPIVHDPARSDGYAYVYDKTQLSRSWFEKGGVAYTFYPSDTGPLSTDPYPATASVPREILLSQNYPNPFNPATLIRFQLPAQCRVSVKVFDLVGNEVAVLVDAERHAGTYTEMFNASGLASGVYFYRLQAGGLSETRTMHLIR